MPQTPPRIAAHDLLFDISSKDSPRLAVTEGFRTTDRTFQFRESLSTTMAADMTGGGGLAAASDPDGLDGVRMTWNNWPRSKIEASKCVIPIAASISPIRSHPDVPTLPYAPLRCKPPCSAILNPFCRVDFIAKIWICPLCYSRNQFPHHYDGISDVNVPGELYPQYTTVEYAPPVLPHQQHAGSSLPPPPVFLFVLDTCVIEEEMGFLKSAMRRAIGLLPDNALVGLISFGTQAYVHELGFSELSKLYVFRGDKEISKEQILDQLGLSSSGIRGGAGSAIAGSQGVPTAFNKSIGMNVNRFLLPASECEYTLNTVSILSHFIEISMNKISLSFQFHIFFTIFGMMELNLKLNFVLILFSAVARRVAT